MDNAAHLLDIPGLTPGGLGIWVLVFGLVAWWIRGMADRRRAGNEGVTAESKASQAQFERLEREIERLTARVTAQDERIDRLEHDLIECEKRHLQAEAEIVRLKAAADIIGEGREMAQLIVSADRVAERKVRQRPLKEES